MTSRIQKEPPQKWECRGEEPSGCRGSSRNKLLCSSQERLALQSECSLLPRLVSVVCTSLIVPGTLVTIQRADVLLWESNHRQEKLRPKIPGFAFPTKAAASALSWPAHTGVPYLTAAQWAHTKTLLGNEWIHLAPPGPSVLTSPR